jgi:hypothetical protein
MLLKMPFAQSEVNARLASISQLAKPAFSGQLEVYRAVMTLTEAKLKQINP